MSDMNDDKLIERAREYIEHKYLDVADVPVFIKRLVELYDANQRLTERVRELETEHEFDLSDTPCYSDPCCAGQV